MRKGLRHAALAAGVVLLTGCGGIPHGGAVHVGRPIPAPGGLGDIDVRVLPAAAQPSMSPAEIVHGFLRALVNSDGGYEIARTYLTHRAASGWNAGQGVTTYDDSGVDISPASGGATSRTLRFRAPRVGAIDARGNFAPRGGRVRATFGLVKQNGQWRIDHLADGVLLSTLDAQRVFRPALVFYLNRSGTTLVPEQVLLRPNTPRVTTALVHALLTGPAPWLAPSVHTAFPAGTELLGSVPVDLHGVAEVNLSTVVRQASPAQLRSLSAQLVWTLQQVSEISVVRLLADGSPLAVPGVPVNQPIASWRTFNPSAPPQSSVAVFDRGGAWQPVGGTLAGLAATTAGLTGVGISDDGSTIAGVRRHPHRASLVVGARGENPISRLSADALTPPTFDPSGAAYTVVTRGPTQTVEVVAADGLVRRVTVDPRLLARPVQRLRISRDGARVAAVVGRPRHGRLLVGRVTVGHGGVQFTAFRDVLPDAADVRGVSWDGGDQLVVTAADVAGGRELLEVDVDGYGTRTIPTSGLPAQPVDLATAPRRPLLVTAGGSVWRNNATGGWSRIGAGDQPVYPD
jgi:hypothetical protein